MGPRSSIRVRGVLLVLCVAVASSSGAGEGSESEVERGRLLYTLYCTSCHGQQGRGDGPVAAELSTPPADLTTIAKRNDGKFPEGAVYRKIYGLEGLPGHQPSEMPLWGFEFMQSDLDANQQEQVRTRIQALVRYLATIQGDEQGGMPPFPQNE